MMGHMIVTSDPNYHCSMTLLIVREHVDCVLNCGHVLGVNLIPNCILDISDVKHQFEQWISASCIMDIVEGEHQFGQWLSAHVYFL